MTRRDFLSTAGAGVVGSALSTGCRSANGLQTERTLRLVQMGDPQFGFSVPTGTASSYAADLRRFEAAVERVNELRPDVVIVMGDLVHRAEDLLRDWPRLRTRFVSPVIILPGNHDLGNRVSRAALDQFRRVIGPDRQTLDVKGWHLIAGNSQFWLPNDLVAETQSYEAWVSAERARARAYSGRVILATHYPPFELYLGENDSPRNCPKTHRIDRVNAWLDAGVRFWLAGHTHTMLSRAHKGMVLLNAETTGRNFDARPFGFRLLTVHEDFSWDWTFSKV